MVSATYFIIKAVTLIYVVSIRSFFLIALLEQLMLKDNTPVNEIVWH